MTTARCEIELTTRNQLPRLVKRVSIGSVRPSSTSAATRSSPPSRDTASERLALGEGDEVIVFVKTTEVMVGKDVDA